MIYKSLFTIIVKKGWFTYLKNLPVLMIEMSKYPELYDDALATRNSTVPLALLSKFPNLRKYRIKSLFEYFQSISLPHKKKIKHFS